MAAWKRISCLSASQVKRGSMCCCTASHCASWVLRSNHMRPRCATWVRSRELPRDGTYRTGLSAGVSCRRKRTMSSRHSGHMSIAVTVVNRTSAIDTRFPHLNVFVCLLSIGACCNVSGRHAGTGGPDRSSSSIRSRLLPAPSRRYGSCLAPPWREERPHSDRRWTTDARNEVTPEAARLSPLPGATERP